MEGRERATGHTDFAEHQNEPLPQLPRDLLQVRAACGGGVPRVEDVHDDVRRGEHRPQVRQVRVEQRRRLIVCLLFVLLTDVVPHPPACGLGAGSGHGAYTVESRPRVCVFGVGCAAVLVFCAVG